MTSVAAVYLCAVVPDRAAAKVRQGREHHLGRPSPPYRPRRAQLPPSPAHFLSRFSCNRRSSVRSGALPVGGGIMSHGQKRSFMRVEALFCESKLIARSEFWWGRGKIHLTFLISQSNPLETCKKLPMLGMLGVLKHPPHPVDRRINILPSSPRDLAIRL